MSKNNDWPDWVSPETIAEVEARIEAEAEGYKDFLRENIPAKGATKAADELPMPERLSDPFGMSFTDDELDALTDVENDDAVKLAMGTATPEKRKLLGAKQVKPKE